MRRLSESLLSFIPTMKTSYRRIISISKRVFASAIASSLLFTASVASGLEVFVDANRGDDTNDGLSQATPVRSLNAAQVLLNKVEPSKPVVLNLARNSVWRESRYPRLFDQREIPFLEARTFRPDGETLAGDHRFSDQRGAFAPFQFGRNNLTVRAYGEGDLPTINGTDLLPNATFARHDPTHFPNVWSQRVVPPLTYWRRAHSDMLARTGLIVGGNRPLFRVYTPLPVSMRDFPDRQAGIETPEDAIRFVNDHPDSFYVQDNRDGSVIYYLNSGSDPTTDGLTYEYKVRSSDFVGKDTVLENIRFYGLSNRNGIDAIQPLAMRGVEVLYGDAHNMLIAVGHFEDVVSIGYATGKRGSLEPAGNTHTPFHTHAPDSPGIIYDRCIAKNGNIAFYDHHKDAKREAVVVRDSITENVNQVLSHGGSTAVSFIIGHRHSGKDGKPQGYLGGLAFKQNYIEDSEFRVNRDQGWHGSCQNLRMRNSVIYMTAGGIPMQMSRTKDYEYENVTLILDLEGKPLGDGRLARGSWKDGTEPGKWLFKNSVIAVINAPNMKTEINGAGNAVTLSDLPLFKFENCVLTYMEGIPESAGKAGEDYVFAAQDAIFSGEPMAGDYTLKADGPAGMRDAGYKVGRTPVYRKLADAAADAMPFPKKKN